MQKINFGRKQEQQLDGRIQHRFDNAYGNGNGIRFRDEPPDVRVLLQRQTVRNHHPVFVIIFHDGH